ncbi:MAG: hypothetical protein LUD68_05140 [Rikenellaceae bacterium]|nr:hypothetical protein [Rikenellaceae bacterium]
MDLYYPYPANSTMYDRSTLRTVRGDFVRLQNVFLTYELFSEKLKRFGIHSLQFMLQGNNLHVWHTGKLKGQDPEATGQSMTYTPSNVGAGSAITFHNTFLPLPRSYSLSVSVQF